MHINEARQQRDLLTQAIEEAEAAGSDQVNLSAQAAALDDAAREELEQVIKDAESN